jgi:FkbM family methyltransferase
MFFVRMNRFIPKSLTVASLPALVFAVVGRKIRKLTGIRLFKRVPVSFKGTRMYLTPEASDGFTFWAEMFDLNPYPTLFAKSENADLFIDCGGNTGAVTCALLCRNPSVRALAFEPYPPTFQRMVANCALNRLTSRVTLSPCAVGAEPGVITIEVDPNNSMAVVEGSAFRSEGATAKQESSITTVDIAVAALGWEPKRIVMKIDVEGFEVEVLKGSGQTLEKTTHVVAECHSDELLAACRDILEAAGFRCVSEALQKGFWGLYADRL